MTQRLEVRKISELIPYENNARTHPPEQIEKLRRSLREFGFVSPVLIDTAGNVIAGHGRLLAAEMEGIETAPCVIAEHLTDAQRRAYILADNRLAETSDWNVAVRDAELLQLRNEGFDFTLTGFDASDISLTPTEDVIEDDCDLTLPEVPVTKKGDLWRLGRHFLLCGDAMSAEDVQVAMGGGTRGSPSHRSAIWRGLYGLRQKSAQRDSERHEGRSRRLAGYLSCKRRGMDAGGCRLLYLVPFGAEPV